MEVDAAQDSITTDSTSAIIALSTQPLPPPQLSSSAAVEDCSEMETDWRLSDNTGETSAFIDDRCTIDRPFSINERFVNVLDHLDTRVEKLRKDALGLQEKRDYLLMSIDLMKHNEMLQGLQEYEREEITCYIKRVSARLSTIELNVKTVRDKDQEESLCQVNTMIDSLITSNDPVLSRQRCQAFLDACCSSDLHLPENNINIASQSASTSVGPIFHDKKFESALLGCTLDDQKNIKKRLLALISYLNQQTITD